ncbi:hypothetical protein MGYG_08241 [Nannizzia gypsea CBS 118893]|uniref:Noranthrone monooxygenase n=1 Tax=Arthroderma gypseum (strain ATCC MYA-4604 / CBS 118893) TaxID=535722 RepID=E4V646_ARTGP|nr:hypothetical protein MGYG_08241 [Nannizzia gypsea CBS 118893]EFR05229.1 hypothetical protein MGYG_08241 [Nannizzia gypsea CBS 118893]
MPHSSSVIRPEATAVVTGSFLAGAMMNISMLAIPVLIDTTDQPSQLINQWVRVYHYGHRVLPGISIATCGLYAYAAFRKRSAGRPWGVFAAAALTTLTMLPFTWTIIQPIINTLNAAQEACKAGQVVEWDEALALVTTWTAMHTTRALFPLTGAIIGIWGMLNQI